jgi:hypothetical protein
MTDQAINPESLAESISSASQPHLQDHPVSLRLRRARTSPDKETISLSLRRRILSPTSRSPSVKSESSGPKTSASSQRLSPRMPSSDTSARSSLTSPRYTKTGRVSKAKKGVRGAHVCVCGKVSLFFAIIGVPEASHMHVTTSVHFGGPNAFTQFHNCFNSNATFAY